MRMTGGAMAGNGGVIVSAGATDQPLIKWDYGATKRVPAYRLQVAPDGSIQDKPRVEAKKTKLERADAPWDF